MPVRGVASENAGYLSNFATGSLKFLFLSEIRKKSVRLVVLLPRIPPHPQPHHAHAQAIALHMRAPLHYAAGAAI